MQHLIQVMFLNNLRFQNGPLQANKMK